MIHFSFFTCIQLASTKALYTLPQSVGIAGGCPSFSLVRRRTICSIWTLIIHQTIPLRPPKQTSKRGIPDQAIRQVRRLRPVAQARLPISFASPLSKRLSTSSSSSRGAQVRWNTVCANDGGSELPGWASDVPLRACAQNAAFGSRSEYAHRVFVQDGGGLDRSSRQSGRGTQLALITKDVTLN